MGGWRSRRERASPAAPISPRRSSAPPRRRDCCSASSGASPRRSRRSSPASRPAARIRPMRNVPAVARRDLAAYFHSPAGLAIAALFLTLQGLVIWMFIQFLGRPDAPPGGVMEFFFGGTILYWIAIALLATVIPMRLVAEERGTATI